MLFPLNGKCVRRQRTLSGKYHMRRATGSRAAECPDQCSVPVLAWKPRLVRAAAPPAPHPLSPRPSGKSRTSSNVTVPRVALSRRERQWLETPPWHLQPVQEIGVRVARFSRRRASARARARRGEPRGRPRPSGGREPRQAFVPASRPSSPRAHRARRQAFPRLRPDPLEVARQLLDGVDRGDALDLDGDPPVFGVTTHQVDGTHVGRPLPPDEPELLTECVREQRQSCSWRSRSTPSFASAVDSSNVRARRRSGSRRSGCRACPRSCLPACAPRCAERFPWARSRSGGHPICGLNPPVSAWTRNEPSDFSISRRTASGRRR